MPRPAPRPTPEDHLPLKPVDFHILMVLLDGKRHGYGMVQDIAERTGGRIQLVPGNFYAMLHRLIEIGLLAEALGADDGSGGKRRRYYRITPLGKRVAAAEAQRLRQLVREAEAKRLIRDTV